MDPSSGAGRPGAYVHVPFCAHRCSYCSFAALTGLDGEARYFGAVVREVESRAGEAGELDSLYFGGGTPSYVPAGRLERVRRALTETFGIVTGAEITAEANPDDLDAEKVERLRLAGVNRLSVGVQSLDDAELPFLERRHGARQAIEALRRARPIFERLSGDLMIGIPGQTRESLRRSVHGLLGTGVDHLSVYLLEMEKAPRLVALQKERPELFADDGEAAARWELVDELASEAGLLRYELSNWARAGAESRHNLKYWRQIPNLGFGLAAHSFDGHVRRANSSGLADYVARIARDGRAFVSEIRLSGEDLARERLVLALRIADGVPVDEIERARAALGAEDRERLDEREAAGLLERVGGRVRLTRRGVLMSNEIFSLLV